MRSLWIDLKYAVRMILGSPGFAMVAVISLALGIGANTVIFSIVNTLLLKPLPVDQPEQLVTLLTRGLGAGEKYNSISYPTYQDVAARDTVFSGVACASFTPLGLKSNQGEAKIILGQMVTANFFDVVGVKPILGRTFLPEENETEGTHPVALLSEELWNSRFAGTEDIIDKSIILNGYSFVVIGVMPDSYEGLNIGIEPEIWVPLMMHRQTGAFDFELISRGNQFLRAVARMNAGVTIEQARADLEILAANLEQEYPDLEENRAFTLIHTNDDRVMVIMTGGNGIDRLMIALMSVVGLVLLIACSNVASIMLARATGRRKEIAIRLALGAGRLRIIRQLLTESILLALVAGMSGILLAQWTIGLIHNLELPFFDKFPVDFSLDMNVLVFTLGVSIVTGIIFGLVPALQVLKPKIVSALKDQGKSASQTTGKSRLQSLLVVAQVCMSLFLLITAGMFIKSLQNAEHLDPGFNPQNNAVLSINLGLSQYEEEDGLRFFDDLIREIRMMPGVTEAGYSDSIPLGFNQSSSSVTIPGYEPGKDESMTINRANVSAEYFAAMGIPILMGREFEETDDADGEPVIIINEAMAKRFFRDEDPLGRIVRVWNEDRRVVGIAKNSKYYKLKEAPLPFMYMCLAQEYMQWQNLHIRTEMDAKAALAPAMSVLRDLDPNLPLFSVDTMENHMGFALLPARVIGSLVGMFGLIALVLSITGIYGVMAYTVSQRTNEFGIRMAIGAQKSDVLKLVFKKGMTISLIGMTLGAVLALAVGGMLSGFLYDVDAKDPLIFSTVIGILLIAALLACYVPARRAMRVDPMAALRYD